MAFVKESNHVELAKRASRRAFELAWLTADGDALKSDLLGFHRAFHRLAERIRELENENQNLMEKEINNE